MTAYAELHAHSDFSFLDGASDPEELVAEGHRLGLRALALTDHHGLYGVVRFAEAARVVGLPTVFGSEVTLSPAGRGLVSLIPRGCTWWCWRVIPTGTPVSPPCWRTRTFVAARREGRLSSSESWLISTGATGWC